MPASPPVGAITPTRPLALLAATLSTRGREKWRRIRERRGAGMTADAYASLRALLEQAGYTFVEPPILHDATVFVEVAGEDLRRRMFLTSADGAELALRPDYTIPVCLHHLATGAATRKAGYAYLGPVFRQRAEGADEFLQAGIESLGRTDSIAADADVLALAFAAAKHLGVAKPAVKIGDSGLFSALLGALDVSEPWKRRLARAFGDAARLKMLIAKADEPPPAPEPDDALAALAKADRATIRDVAAELFAATGLGVIGGRTADEIADRFVEKRVLGDGIGERARDVLTAFLAIAGPPPKAIDEVAAIARDANADIGKAVDRFGKRIDAFAKRDIDVEKLAFAANFGRRIDYYTGFVFEFHRGKRAKTGAIIGGGRYDRLMALIPHPDGASAKHPVVPAVGFAIWLDRIGARK